MKLTRNQLKNLIHESLRELDYNDDKFKYFKNPPQTDFAIALDKKESSVFLDGGADALRELALQLAQDNTNHTDPVVDPSKLAADLLRHAIKRLHDGDPALGGDPGKVDENAPK